MCGFMVMWHHINPQSGVFYTTVICQQLQYVFLIYIFEQLVSHMNASVLKLGNVGIAWESLHAVALELLKC